MQEHTFALCYQVSIRKEEIAHNGYIYGHSQHLEFKRDSGEGESRLAFN